MLGLNTPTQAHLSSFTSRVEKRGEDDVPAISLGFKITAANTILDTLSPTLRETLYTRPEGQDDLPGVESTTPLLRTKGIELLTLNGVLEGWTLTVDHGIDEESQIVAAGCKVDNFRVSPKEGGTVELMFRVGTANVTPEEAGLLWAKNHQDVSILLEPPKKAEGPLIDGTTEAFAKDHPDAGDMFAAAHSADEAFAGLQEDPGPPDSDSEGGDPDVSDKPARRSRRREAAAVE